MSECTCKGNAPSWAGRDVLAVITGASRGLGASLAEQIVKIFCSNDQTCPKSITLFLIGRTQESLENTKKAVEALSSECHCKAEVVIDPSFLIDFAHASEKQMAQCIQIITKYADKFESNNELHLLFNNAATIGDVEKKAYQMTDVDRINTYTRINLTSMMCFTSLYLQSIKPLHKDQNFDHRLVCIINISSICGLIPFKHMPEYCSIKAARIMFMRCLAADRDDIALFNYSPGPLKTDMFQEVTSNMKDAEAVKGFKELEEKNQILEPYKSAQECISWLGFMSTPKEAKHGNLCHKHHAEYMGLYTGTQLDYFDAKDLPNPYRVATN